MSLKTRLLEDIKQAMRAGERTRLTTLRMATAAIKQREVDERSEVSDEDVVQIIEKMIKQRRESVSQFRQGGREERAAAEQAEIEVLADYLPEPLDQATLDQMIDQAIAGSGAAQVADMGRVMAALKPKVQGRADMREVSTRVRSRLTAD